MADIGALVVEHLEKAYAVARAVTDSTADAEDALSTAVTRLLSGAERRDEARTFFPYFARAVVNAAHSLRRSEGRRAAREEKVMAENGRHRRPEPLELRETASAVRSALGALPPEERAAVVLTHLEGLSQAAAGEALGLPQRTVSRHAREGLKRMRGRLARAGFAGALAPVLLTAAVCEPVPGLLAGHVGKLVAGAKATTAGGSTGASVLTGGGVAMKAIVGVIAAGTLAGAVAVSMGMGGGASTPLAAQGDGVPVPVNPYTERQDREEVFEFTTKPAVKKKGDKWVITFASKGACDATVTIVDKKGKVVRHLASGVLGKNAPYPFQQNSLSQKIAWDGRTDMHKPAPAGCRVKVGLGLKATFERNICYDPNDLAGGGHDVFKQKYGNTVSAKADGKLYAGVINGYGINSVCRVFDKNGKYIKTVWPPPAAEWEKIAAAVGIKTATTIWGDKVPALTHKSGPWSRRGDRKLKQIDKCSRPFGDMLSKITGVTGFKVGPKPASIPPGKDEALVGSWLWGQKFLHLIVDPDRDYLYVGAKKIARFNGATGEVNTGWFGGVIGSKYSEMAVGPDGLLYLRYGGSANGYHMFRLDQEKHKIVPFKSEYVVKDWSHLPDKNRQGYHSVPKHLSPDFSLAPLGAVWVGNSGNSGCFQTGLNISPDGKIVTGLREVDPGWAKRQGHPEIKRGSGSYLSVYDLDGKLLGVNVIGDTGNGGHGVAIDSAGNVYAGFGGCMPGKAGAKNRAYTCKLDGIADDKIMNGSYGSIIKFRNQGGKYPLNTGPGAHAHRKYTGTPKEVPGALWVYGGMTGMTTGSCCCHHIRFKMDRHARIWIPAGYLTSIMVLDANSNRIARFGRYGNVDDTEADIKAGRDGLRFVWPRAVAASESAMYVLDPHNRRILKAKLGYHAEEELPLP